MYRKMQSKQLAPPQKVLVISSDTMLGEITTKIISRYFGCEIYTAMNASEAASYLYSGGFDLAIMDLSTQGLSGPMMVRKIQSVPRNVSILVIADIDNNESLEEIQGLGINQIIYKPIKMVQMLELITGILLESQQIFV